MAINARIKAKLPVWLSEKQTAVIEAGYNHLGRFASWWAVENGKEEAGVEAVAQTAVDRLSNALVDHSNGDRWALGDFGRFSGVSEGKVK